MSGTISDPGENKYNYINPPITFNHTNGTTNPRCQHGHQWTYSGAINYDLEGMPCDCGEVTFHTEICNCCNQSVQKHKPNN